MPSISTHELGNGRDSAKNSALTSAASKGNCQRVRLHYIGNINRFLADQDQTPPVSLSPVQTEDEAVAAGKARGSATIRAFDNQFGCGNNSPEVKSTCTQNSRNC